MSSLLEREFKPDVEQLEGRDTTSLLNSSFLNAMPFLALNGSGTQNIMATIGQAPLIAQQIGVGEVNLNFDIVVLLNNVGNRGFNLSPDKIEGFFATNPLFFQLGRLNTSLLAA